MSNQAKIKTKLVAVGYAPILSETKEKQHMVIQFISQPGKPVAESIL